MALFCHLGGLAGYVIPVGNIILPLILWQVNKDKMPFVNDQGKEAVNFQISVTIYAIASIILAFVTCGVGFFLPIAVGVFALVVMILASVDANKGIPYRYPLCIRLIN